MKAQTLCTSQQMHMLRHRCLVWDLVLVVLEHIVCSAPVEKEKQRQSEKSKQSLEVAVKEDHSMIGIHKPVAEEAVLDDFNDEGSCIFLAQPRVESLPECAHIL